jgi:hypothetical protein
MTEKTLAKIPNAVTLSKDNLLRAIVSGMSHTCLQTNKITISKSLVDVYLALFCGEWGVDLRQILHQAESTSKGTFSISLLNLLKSKWQMLEKEDFLVLFRDGLSGRLRSEDGQRELSSEKAQIAMRNILLDPWLKVYTEFLFTTETNRPSP